MVRLGRERNGVRYRHAFHVRITTSGRNIVQCKAFLWIR